jgi:Tfp pilus assembly protein PilF
MGRMQLDRRTRAGCLRAVEHFQRAVELDPEYVPAWVGLADAQGLIASYGYDAGAGSHAAAKRAALRALELDPHSAAAHASLAMFYAAHQDIPAWQREIETALRLNPGYAEAHNWKGYYLQLTGRAAEGCESARRAVELDPLSAEAASNLSLGLLTTGDAEGALAEARRSAELSPGWTTAPFYEALALLALGRPREAAARLAGLHVEWSGLGAEATLVVARMATGDEPAARREAAALDASADPFAAGLASLAVGEVDGGFELMHQAERLTDWPSLAVHFLYRDVWAPVRDDERLRELARRAVTSWGLEPPEEDEDA